MPDIIQLRWIIGTILLLLLALRLILARLIIKKRIGIFSIIKLARVCEDHSVRTFARFVLGFSVVAYAAILTLIILYKLI